MNGEPPMPGHAQTHAPMPVLLLRSGVLGALLFCLAGPASAQFVGGMKAGITSATFTGETGTDFEARFGWGGGVVIGYDAGRGVLIQTELLYVVKGAGTEMTGAELDALLGQAPSPGAEDLVLRLDWDLAYVEIPVLLTYRLETRSSLHPRVFAGPALGYRLSSELHFRAAGGGPEFSETDESIREIDTGIVLGGGVDVEFGYERISLDLRTTLGQSNIRSGDPPIHNRSVAFFVGLVF